MPLTLDLYIRYSQPGSGTGFSKLGNAVNQILRVKSDKYQVLLATMRRHLFSLQPLQQKEASEVVVALALEGPQLQTNHHISQVAPDKEAL